MATGGNRSRRASWTLARTPELLDQVVRNPHLRDAVASGTCALDELTASADEAAAATRAAPTSAVDAAAGTTRAADAAAGTTRAAPSSAVDEAAGTTRAVPSSAVDEAAGTTRAAPTRAADAAAGTTRAAPTRAVDEAADGVRVTPNEQAVLMTTATRRGRDLTPTELDTELAIVGRTAPRPITDGPYQAEVALPNGHEWKRRDDGFWCRFSDTPDRCVPEGSVGTPGRLAIVGDVSQYSASELRAAQYMADQGHDVVLRPPTGTRAGGGTSDLVVNGVNYDVYTPKTSNPNRIISAIRSKNSQAVGIVLDLSQSTVKPSDLGDVLLRVRNAGGTNIQKIVIIE